ncbi:Transcriptional regulatory protein DegU [Methylobacterium crusticola]|uniref:Transcriptional regulatory protein DegU n=1 Tax=Methylobacterium crusticola TaxID=1697972 RepID=A0ABQ4QU58_9HYPH|nr:Transcriptional regulatory protein DegU [Methylobacterium crusticola]
MEKSPPSRDIPGSREIAIEGSGGHLKAIEATVRRAPAIILVDPRQLVRECFSRCLAEAIPDHEIITFASIDAWDRAGIGHRDGDMVVLYYDPREAVRSGPQREAALLSRIGPGANVVLLCDSEDPGEIIERLNEGARGYIPTNVSLKVAIEAMRLVRAGGVFVPASCLLQRRGPADETASADPRSQFTPRQTAVLERLQKGKANKVIAFELNMQESTVKVHVRNLIKKLGVTNRTEVVARTYRRP